MSAAEHWQAVAELTAPGQDYEIVEQTVRGGLVCRVFKNAPGSLLDLLTASEPWGDLIYLRYRGEEYSFNEVRSRTAKIARFLRERLNVGRGDRVAVCMRNYPEWVVSFFAPISLGAVSVAFNGWWSGEEIEYGLKDCGAKALLIDEERLQRIEGRLPDLGVPAVAVRTPRTPTERIAIFDEVIAASDESALPAIESDPDDDAMMLYTSGSTGHPKGAISTHRNVLHALLSWELEGRVASKLANITPPVEPTEAQYRLLVSIPFFHVTASHVCLLGGLRAGRRLTLMHKWDVEEALDTIEREKITHFTSVPTITGDLIRAAREQGRTLPSLLGIGGGGAHRPARQVLETVEVLQNALPGTGWGMTETNAIGTLIRNQNYLRHPNSSGRCSAVLDMRFVGTDGNDVPRGEPGEVWIRGTSVIRGYWNKPEATAKAFENGWLKTGDIAYIDEDDFVFFVDRIKDIVIRGGENISCGAVEDALYKCAGVAEAVAVGIPDERLGEDLAAVVVPEPGVELSAAELQEELRKHLAGFEVPSRIYFREEPLPRIASGKFAKRKIRAELTSA